MRFIPNYGKIKQNKAYPFCGKGVKETVKDYIEAVLSPRIQADGGWVEFVSLEGENLTLLFRGECSKCLILDRCVSWIAQKIREDLGRDVRITAVRKKPFFWDRA